MNFRISSILIGLILCFALSCESETKQQTKNPINPTNKMEEEKQAILDVINNETKAAFSRDYEGWKDKWMHEPYVTKTYINFLEDSMTETLGWKEIDDFVRIYIEEHPEPDPIPTLVDDIQVRLYGTGAWVTYEQNDGPRGTKRETRLMEKVDGQWKIAGMHTTIYGAKPNK